MDATISIFWRPSRHVKGRMLPWPPLNSSSLPGRRDWTGAMLAGWPMGQCSIQSPYQGRAVGVQTCLLGCVATGNGIVFFTALTPSALQPLLRVSVWLLTLVFYSANVHKKVCKTLSVTFGPGATLSPTHFFPVSLSFLWRQAQSTSYTQTSSTSLRQSRLASKMAVKLPKWVSSMLRGGSWDWTAAMPAGWLTGVSATLSLSPALTVAPLSQGYVTLAFSLKITNIMFTAIGKHDLITVK